MQRVWVDSVRYRARVIGYDPHTLSTRRSPHAERFREGGRRWMRAATNRKKKRTTRKHKAPHDNIRRNVNTGNS